MIGQVIVEKEKLETFLTDKQTDRQRTVQKTEATLILCGSLGKRANSTRLKC